MTTIITYLLPVCYLYVAKLNMKEMEIISHIPIVKRGSETLIPTVELTNCIPYKFKVGII